MTRGTKFLIFGLVGSGLFLALICGGLIFLAVKGLQEIPKVTASADAFMNQIQAKQIEQAYRSTTSEFQGKVSLEQFQALIVRYPAFTNQTSRSTGGIRLFQTGTGVRGYVQYTLASPNNTLSLNLTLKNDNGSWKVESINFQ